MKTISIKVETVGKGIRATLNTYVIGTGDVFQSVIKDPFSEHPFYFLDGARHDLTEQEKKKLRELIEEAKDNV